MKKAVVLLSGGLDSATTLAIALKEGRECYPLMVHYGQRHTKETAAAMRIIQFFHREQLPVAKPTFVEIHARNLFESSSLVNQSMQLPVDGPGIPSTYVPHRNLIMLGLAAAKAEDIQGDEIWIGANAVDYSGYPDCRETFFEFGEHAINHGSKRFVTGLGKINIRTPLLFWPKTQIIEEARKLGVPLKLTWSCYAGGHEPCGKCPSCVIRAAAFKALKMDDPALEGGK